MRLYSLLAMAIVSLVANGVVGSLVNYRTKLGTIVGTQTETTFKGKTGKVNRFRGIPFAESPTGTRRFRKPVAKGQLPNPFNATEFGPACPQDLFMLTAWVPGFPYMDEDCLTLNVFTPENSTQASYYAVMVWIYGGAYVIGQSKIYSAENLTLVGDVIVVTLNYRVTSFGFLSTESSKYPGNNGLWDQQLALQWVHDNIADYGGDPSRVTIFGESAGGSSVLYHSLYERNRGLYQRLIAESGSPLCPWAFQSAPAKYARRLANKLGCTASNLDTAIDCLQTKDFMLIANNSLGIGTFEETMFRAEWDPSFDNDFIKKPQKDLFKSGLGMFRDMDYMVGMNNNDGAFVTLIGIQMYMQKHINRTFESGIPRDFFRNSYVPLFLNDMGIHTSKRLVDWVTHVYTDWRDPDNDLYMREKFLQFSGDYNFFMPALQTIAAHAKKPTTGKSYLYNFHTRPSFNRSPTWVKGANHGEELPFVFGFPYTMADGMRFYDHVPETEKQISENMMIMWSNFAKSGDPNSPVRVPQSISWPEYDVDTERYLLLETNATSIAQRLFARRAEFWMHFLPDMTSAIHI